MATIIRQSYIDKIERYLGKETVIVSSRLGTQCIPNLGILLFLPILAFAGFITLRHIL